MMLDINAMLLAVSGSQAASVVVKATAIAAAGLLGARLASRSRAAVRHALLAVAFGALAVLPLVTLAAPPIRIALRMAAREAPVAAAPMAAAVTVAPGELREVPVEAPPAKLTPAAWLAAAWIAGAALFLLQVLVGLLQVGRLRRTGLPWRQGQTMAEGLAAETGVRRRVEVLLHEELAGPMMCGALRPAVALPVDARNWKNQDLKRALVHEMEHVRRGDWLTHCFVRAVCAAYWFHPLVWIARRELVLEAERACDDAVLARSEATEYADQLVGVAERLLAAARSPQLAMADRADLAKRVRAVLDGRQRRGRAGAAAVALACAAAAAVVLIVAPLQVVAAPEPVVADPTSGAPVLTPAPAPMAAAPQTTAARPRAVTPRSAGAGVPGNQTLPKQEPLLVAAAPQAAPAPPAAGAPMMRLSAETMLVTLNVAASYPNGGNIAGLTAGDFVVTEDGLAQSIKVFEYQDLGSAAQGAGQPVSSYYTLGYYTSNTTLDGKFRRIHVSIPGNTAAKLDVRTGYFARGGGAAVNSDNPGPGVTLPIIQHKVEPAYSEAARKAKFQGTVVLLITVNADGTVGDAYVTSSLGLGLDEQAIKAVRMWKFIPGRKNLVPVPMQAQVVVSFRMM